MVLYKEFKKQKNFQNIIVKLSIFSNNLYGYNRIYDCYDSEIILFIKIINNITKNKI